jgi:hypothetical protein
MAVHDSDERVASLFPPLVALLPTLVIHADSTACNESVAFRYDSSDGANLHLILPTFIRDARYQGDAR